MTSSGAMDGEVGNAVAKLPALALAQVSEILPPPGARRILFFSKRKRHTRVPSHLIRGFENNGHQVLWVRPSKWRRFLGKRGRNCALGLLARSWKPDMILVYKADATPDLLDAMPKDLPVILYYEDLPLPDPNEPDGDLIATGRKCDIFFTTARGLIPVFESKGVPRCVYLRGGVDPTDHRLGAMRPELRSDLAFIGQASDAGRVGLMGSLAKQFDVKLYGRGWQEQLGIAPTHEHVEPDRYGDICASAALIVGMDARSDVDLYFSNRTWLTLGCGGCLLTHYIPGLEEFFNNHEHLIWFHSEAECAELAQHYLAHPDERKRIAKAGHDLVHRYHTFTHATAEMIATLEGRPWYSKVNLS